MKNLTLNKVAKEIQKELASDNYSVELKTIKSLIEFEATDTEATIAAAKQTIRGSCNKNEDGEGYNCWQGVDGFNAENHQEKYIADAREWVSRGMILDAVSLLSQDPEKLKQVREINVNTHRNILEKQAQNFSRTNIENWDTLPCGEKYRDGFFVRGRLCCDYRIRCIYGGFTAYAKYKGKRIEASGDNLAEAVHNITDKLLAAMGYQIREPYPRVANCQAYKSSCPVAE